MGGKFAPGLRGFPTPNDVAPDGGYVVFRVPKDNEWAGLILGAAQLLSYTYNWYQWGDMTPDEASEAFRQIVDQAPYETCGCVYPNGKRILRLNGAGHVEQLTDGEWTEPTDDYTIPPVPPRTELACDERRCSAAANAANVLQVLYETVADAIAEGADEAEALAVLVGTAVILIGGWLGLVLAALVTAIVGAFVSFVELGLLLVSDLWTADFTEALRCMLYRCSSCDGDVVHFDFQCVREEMAAYTDILDPNFITNLRLFGQVDFILNVIGVDGLDAAGATTAIADAECTDCACEVTITEPCGYGSVEHLGGTRWRGTGLFVDTNWALCLKDVDDKCWGYANWEIISGSIDYQDFSSCDTSGHVGQPGGCAGVPDTGQQSDILSWFLASSAGSFVVEFDAYCHEVCAD